jgi:hypothetical protein
MILGSMSYGPISIDDPDKDYKTIINNTMAFLCERQMTLGHNPVNVSIDTIWKQELSTFQDSNDILSHLKRFQKESNFIEIAGDNISLTQSGIKHCSERR